MRLGPLILMLALWLGGCAIPISHAGHTADYSEVFYGEGSGDAVSNTYTVTFEPSNVICKGAGNALDPFGHWRHTLSCADGRTATLNSHATGLGIGAAEGVMSDGTPLTLEGGLKGHAEELIIQYRQTMAARRAGKAPVAAEEPTKKQIAAKPPVPPAPAPATVPSAAAVAAPPTFPSMPVVSKFPHGAERPDDVAVIIGNADYSKQGKDIPNVKPAYADAEGMRLYATQALGIRDGNVIFLKDATGAQMIRVFGSDRDYRGQLYDWVKPGKSRVFVYFSGHGAPGRDGGSPFLVPADADAARIELNGYPLKTLYDNLGKLPAERVTVVLEACFSGLSQSGSVLGQASPVYFDVKPPPVPAKLTVVTAGAANQVASWEQDGSSGLFTKYFLKGMAGEASHFGRPSLEELDRYLDETLTYWARRYYGRDQTAQIVKGGAP